MSSRRFKAKTKVQGSSIISLLQKSYGKGGLFRVILVKPRKICTPLMIFRPFSILCGAHSANSFSNLPPVWLNKSRKCRRSQVCNDSLVFQAFADLRHHCGDIVDFPDSL